MKHTFCFVGGRISHTTEKKVEEKSVAHHFVASTVDRGSFHQKLGQRSRRRQRDGIRGFPNMTFIRFHPDPLPGVSVVVREKFSYSSVHPAI